eukprot:TRINITY_DN2914_c1_g1_i1.p1 TRINITY_DN2914_c1_g1~~TRINITY_DN2914_c1_g1_i1.p1  ORF type:complete len:200 (+),score=71.28 TRINITY_DN2914_c1_g1_i1:23-622(+)
MSDSQIAYGNQGIQNTIGALDFGQLIGKPLMDIAAGQGEAAQIALDFIQQFGFDENGKTRNTTFSIKLDDTSGATAKQVEATIEVPNLALVHLPSLCVDEVDIDFTAEVKSTASDTSQSTYQSSGSYSRSSWWCRQKYQSKSSYSSAYKNTRSTDTSAKYHCNVNAKDLGPSEGLSRVLTMLNKLIPENIPDEETETTE